MINSSPQAENSTKYEQTVTSAISSGQIQAPPKTESQKKREQDPSLPKDSVEFSFGEQREHTSSGNSQEPTSSSPPAFAENGFFKLRLQDQGHHSGALKNLFHHAGFQSQVGSTLNISH